MKELCGVKGYSTSSFFCSSRNWRRSFDNRTQRAHDRGGFGLDHEVRHTSVWQTGHLNLIRTLLAHVPLSTTIPAFIRSGRHHHPLAIKTFGNVGFDPR